MQAAVQAKSDLQTLEHYTFVVTALGRLISKLAAKLSL
jgi:hypothetical protein